MREQEGQTFLHTVLDAAPGLIRKEEQKSLLFLPTLLSHELWRGLCPPGGRAIVVIVKRPLLYAQGPS